MQRSKDSLFSVTDASQCLLTTTPSSGHWIRSQPWCLRIVEGWCHYFWLCLEKRSCMLLISERSHVMREDQYGHLCACVSAGTGTITSVCVCQLCNSALNVIKQVLYNGRFLTCKAFAVCYENVFLTLWWAFVWDVSAVQTVNTAGLHFFGGGRIVNFEPPEDVVKPVM